MLSEKNSIGGDLNVAGVTHRASSMMQSGAPGARVWVYFGSSHVRRPFITSWDEVCFTRNKGALESITFRCI